MPKLDITIVEPIDRGWSCDRKYRVAARDGAQYLLRVTPPEHSASRADMFRMQQRVAALGIPMCMPVDIWTDEAGVNILQTWIAGDDASCVLPELPDAQQYAYGLDAGRILRRIHSIPAPASQQDWAERFNRKIDKKINLYLQCPIKCEGGQAFIDYIEANRHLLAGRPQTFQHGDYHIGNMMIDRAGRLCVIDFDRCDFGDPWEEFNRIVWCAQKSPLFATGMVDGYFDGDVPLEFWKLLALYISSNTLSSVYWAVPYGQTEIDVMLNQAREVLNWYDGMRNVVPAWYAQGYYIQWIDGIPFRLKREFDFGFMADYGRVFKVFDDQDSGNICFGTQKDGRRYFVKFAGAPTVRGVDAPEAAIARLKATLPVYRDLRHPCLIELVEAREVGGGFAMAFNWADGDCMGRQYPAAHRRFMQLPASARLDVFRDILSFFECVAARGYVGIDFYDGSIMYDFARGRTTICDVDFFRRQPCVNDMGRMWGSSRFQAPEEYQLGAVIDEVTNVYTLGATAFALFGGYSRARDDWQLSDGLYAIAAAAVSDQRAQRQQSIAQFSAQWQAALQHTAQAQR